MNIYVKTNDIALFYFGYTEAIENIYNINIVVFNNF